MNILMSNNYQICFAHWLQLECIIIQHPLHIQKSQHTIRRLVATNGNNVGTPKEIRLLSRDGLGRIYPISLLSRGGCQCIIRWEKGASYSFDLGRNHEKFQGKVD